jgi:hypothetical protein
LDGSPGGSRGELANGKKSGNLRHFFDVWAALGEARLYGLWTKKPPRCDKSASSWKKSCRTLYKTEKVGIIKIDGFGLFSVPAPPFRFPASGGVFLLLARQYNQVLIFFWFACECIHAHEDLDH